MAIITRRTSQPVLTGSREKILALYGYQLRAGENLASATICNYLSDVRHFAAWWEFVWKQGRETEPSFAPGAVTTPTLTDYRAYLQQKPHLKPGSINRDLISLKRYFAWLLSTGQIKHDPAQVVKLVGEEGTSPRPLNDQEEQALVAAVTEKGDRRDRAIIVLLLHTGLRARELCTITRSQVRPGKQSGTRIVQGKRNKYRENPLNATARAALVAYASFLPKPSHDPTPLFLSEKRHTQRTGQRSGYLIKKYADRAHVNDVGPHDLRHRFGYRMARSVLLHRLAQLMGHDSPGTTMLYVQGTQQDLQQDVEKIAWI